METPDRIYIDENDYYTPWSENNRDKFDVCYIKADTLINKIELKLKSLQEVERLANFDVEKAWNRGYAKAKTETLLFIREIIEKESTK